MKPATRQTTINAASSRLASQIGAARRMTTVFHGTNATTPRPSSPWLTVVRVDGTAVPNAKASQPLKKAPTISSRSATLVRRPARPNRAPGIGVGPQLPGPGPAGLLRRRSGTRVPPRYRVTRPPERRLGEYHVRSQLGRPPQEDVHPLVDVLRWRAVYRPGVQEGNLDHRLLVGTQCSGRLPTTDPFRVRPRRDSIRQPGHPADLVGADPAEFGDLGQRRGEQPALPISRPNRQARHDPEKRQHDDAVCDQEAAAAPQRTAIPHGVGQYCD